MFQTAWKKFLWSKEFKTLCLGHMLLEILKAKNLLEHFMKKKKKMLKTNQKDFRVEKGIKSEDNKIYVKWKSYNNSFNSWIDKKEIA